MTRIPLQSKDNFEHFRVASQVDFIGDTRVNHALIALAKEVAELLKQEAHQLEQDRVRADLFSQGMLNPLFSP